MKILQVNKFHYPRGGADKYYLDLGEALESAGHKVAYFSMHHPKNISSPYKKYFVSRLSFNENGIKDKLKIPGRIIYSLEAKKKFKKLLKDFKPDIIHIHNIYHQISPSILDVAKEFDIPVVMHLHDYKLICPNYQLFAHGKICEACKPNKYFKCLKSKCFKDSYFKSLLAALEMHIHHNILKIYKKNISVFIAPSAFMKKKLVEYAWDKDKIKVIINPFSSNLVATEKEIKNIKKEDYLLYFGRLSKEKGLETLIKAVTMGQQKLKIVGIGPEKENLQRIVQDLKTNVEFLGYKSGQELKDIILKAKAVIIPSIWYENMPLSLLEALNLGSIVIAARIGGIPEIVKDQKNGFLFKSGDINDLSRKIKDLEKFNLNTISLQAKESVNNFSPANNFHEVVEVYKNLFK